jgi:3-oxoacyl-[acyl-carrier-protein] synthase-3
MKWLRMSRGIIMKRNVKIQGIGSYLPQRIVSSLEIDKIIGAAPGWSKKKSGVKRRHFVVDETASFMGAEAAKQAPKCRQKQFNRI